MEDTIYLEWKWLYGNLGDEVRVDLFCNGVSAGSIKLEMTDTSYVLDVSMFEPGDLLQVRCSVYYEISHGTNAVSEFYYDYFTIGDIFDGEVYWYVKDNQIYVYMPNANAAAYEIYYGYDKSKADFSNMVEVTKDEIEAGYPLPIDICPITGSNIGVRITPYLANQVIPKELIKVGGIYVEPLLQMIPNVRVTSLEKSVKLQALIGNKVEGFNYEYQWYVSDSKTGMATAINDATSAEYVAYVGDTESKYYYCQITCKYNGEKVYTTVNENGERTRVMGKDCFDNVTISNIKAQNYTGSAITPTITVKEDNTKLVQGTHYEVSYENNINAGTAIAKITFLGAYSAMGMKEKEFVINPMGTSSLTVGAISNQEYTGAAIKPKVSVKNGSTILVLGTDYTVNYSNNLKVGTANVIITFKGNYKGECSTTFNIVYGTGMYKGPDGQWYYYTNGKIDTSYVGIAQNAYGCWYINKGKLDTTYTGLVKDKTDWVYVSNGKLDTTYIGLVKYKSNWVYVNKGKLDVTYTGLVKYKTNWVYVVEGKLNTTYTGLVKYKDSWVYVSKGKLDTTYTGMSQNEAGWWYVSKGKLDATYTGLVKYKTNWVYVVEGKLNTTYTGLVKYNSTWVYVRKGKLDATYTGMAKNQYGWWYVTKGKLDLTFTGIADNAYGTWYLQNGELDLTFSGKVNINGKQYTVKKGKVVK